MVCKEELDAFGGKEYLCRWKDSEKAYGLMPVTIPTAKIQKNKEKSNYFLHLISHHPCQQANQCHVGRVVIVEELAEPAAAASLSIV